MQPNQQQPGYPGNPSQQSGYPGQMQPRGPPNMAQGPPRPPGQFGSQPPRPGMGAPPGSQPPRPGMIPPPGSQPRPGMGAPMQPRGPPSMGAPPGSQPPRPGMGAPMQPRGQPAMGAPQPPRPGMGAPQGSQPPRPGMNPPPGSQPRPGMGAPMQPRGPPSMGAPQGSQPPRPGMGAPMQPRGPPSMGAPQGSQPPRPGMGAPMQPRGPPTMGAPPGSQPPRPGMGAPMQPRGPPAMGAPSGPTMGMPPAMGAPNQQGGFQQAPRGYPPAGVPQQQQQPVNLDPSAQCPDWYTKMTVNKFPASKTLAQQCKVPIGALIRPLAKSPDGEEIPTVYYGNIGVQRCKSCRAYINPFVQWIENGRRWRCNICGLIDDTKSQYYSHLDASGQRADRNERAELSKGIYEIVAPQDYMIRPPQSPVYVFVIDVSDQAVKSGMLHVACDAIKKSLDHLPGAPRTQVAVITYDYAIHFYNLRSNLTQPQMMVVSDLEDVFVPIPEDLLVNLAESRQQVEDLLTALPTMHANNHGMETAFGCAIMAAYRVMAHIGGKMCVFQSKLPVIGEGKLQPRAQPGVVGSDKEHTFLQQAGNFYKSRAVEFIRVHICVELFLFPHNYCDVSTLQTLPKYTGGQLHYFPRFNASRDGESFFHALHRTLSRDNGWEAVMRVRASRGVHVASNAFYGNVVVRGTDLLSLPNIDEDMTFGVEFTHEEAVVPTGTVTIQGALLYTNSAGERRIRVSTLCLPVATQAADVLQSSNQDAVAVLYGKMTVDRLLSDGLDAARKQLQKLCVDIIRAVQTGYGGAYGGGGASYPGGPPQMQMQQQQQQRPNLPPSLNLLPLYIMALIKNPVFRGGSDISLDERAFAIHRFCRVSLKLAMVLLYPNFYPMHSMAEDCGRLVAVPKDDAGVPAKPSEDPADILRIDDQRVKLPAVTGLSGERLQSDGYFLLDTGYTLYMWIGRAVPPATLQSLFGLASLEGIDSGVLKLEPTETDDELKKRVLNIVRAIQKSREVFAPLIFVKEGDTYTEPKFYSYLVEDRASFPGGAFNYGEFFQQVMRLAH